MRVIGKPAILKFSEWRRDALVPLMNWYRIARKADWGSLAEVRRDFSHADIVGRRTVFNIHGNDYRLIAALQYRAGVLAIRFFGSHAEYDEIDAGTV